MSFLKSSLLVAVTAFIVTIIPGYFKPSFPVPTIYGSVAPGFEDVSTVFRENFEQGWDKSESGSALCIYHKGEKVVDLWAGYADQEASMLWKEDTMTVVFSITKGLSALCVATLADRGLLDFKKPVAFYWPEFAQYGKDSVTVEMLLEHEAGLAIISEDMTFDLVRDHAAMDKVLAATKPLWEPGTSHGYHAVSIGFYMDAIVRRVDPKGRTIGQFFKEEIAEPFGIDAYIGAPIEVTHRMARSIFINPSLSDMIYGLWTSSVYRSIIYGFVMGRAELLIGTVTNSGEVGELERQVDPQLRKLEIPSINGVATARGLAKLFGILANGGKLGNKTLLSQELINEYAHDKGEPSPDVILLNLPLKWKYGMNIIKQVGEDNNIFGASGSGGQLAYADQGRRLSYGFLTRFISATGLQFYDPRLYRLKEVVMKTVDKLG